MSLLIPYLLDSIDTAATLLETALEAEAALDAEAALEAALKTRKN